jgi:FAD:protein FMN transferase
MLAAKPAVAGLVTSSRCGVAGRAPSKPAPRALAATLLAVLVLPGCRLQSRQPATESFKSMGTLAAVTLGAADRDRLQAVTAEVCAEFDRLEGLLSTYREDSEISRLAGTAGRSGLRVSPDTYRILELSRTYGELTGGAFDITVGPLVRLWGFGVHPPTAAPEPAEIAATRKLVDFRRLELHGGTAFLPEGMSVDLGAIGKGFAVDHGTAILHRRGIRAGMIDLSGNIRVIGQAGPGEAWTIGVRNPFDKAQVLGTIALESDMAIATSGNYERFVELGGRRYSHIIDPRTGYPTGGMAGVTVVCPDATLADAMSTGLFVLGPEAGVRLIRESGCTGALFIPDKDTVEIIVTPGMEALFLPRPWSEFSVKRLH